MIENKKLTVINFFSGPGTGKSTIASALFSKMKRQKMKVELVHEVAKDLVWDNSHDLFAEQDWIFAQQHHRIHRLVHHDIDYAIVDSSLLLSILYAPEAYPASFTQFVFDVYNTYTNINILIERNPNFQYVQEGRNETVEQAIEKDIEIRDLLTDCAQSYKSFLNVDGVEDNILKYIEQHQLTLP